MWPFRRRSRPMTEFERVEYCATFDSEYQYKLGLMYLKGGAAGRPSQRNFITVPKDEAKGLHLIRQAAEQGAAMASELLSVFYFGREDLQKGFMWKQKAAEQGLANAQAQLGILYAADGFGQRDDVKACAWLTVAAANGASGGTEYLDRLVQTLSLSQKHEVQRLSAELLKRIPRIPFEDTLVQNRNLKKG